MVVCETTPRDDDDPLAAEVLDSAGLIIFRAKVSGVPPVDEDIGFIGILPSGELHPLSP
jgi:hypothetical protein